MTTEPEFQGSIGRTFKDSEPWWPPAPATADGKTPNVVVILFDDLGFSHFGCYGSTIETPNIDALAAKGLRFTNFHTTALCSPTRASLLTGRNHHSIGMRGIADYDSGFPNMRGAITRNAATLAEMLRDHGYATFATGKWHLTPREERSAAGPFDAWPLQRGFDHYYGFLSGAEDQFYPDLSEDNHHVHPPRTPEEGYHVSEDIIDHAIGYIRDHRSVYPARPFFLYVPFGATHSPHQAPKEYIDKYRGKFDQGWDATREEWYQRQLASGIIPEGTDLAPRNPGVVPWEDLSENARKLAARLQEAFAGFLDHTDAQIGRLVQFLDETGDLDNTILMITADNGASQEGGPQGITDEARYAHPVLDDLDTIEERLEDIGGPHSSPNYPWGWSQAGNTPLKWYKSTVHGGGIRDPLVVHWPKGISDQGAIRHEFHHVTDIVPTVLELLDFEAPTTFQGIDQMPISGSSFAYAMAGDPEAERRSPQYFEMFGHRAMWADGWKATSRHKKNDPYSDDEWQLYHLDEDFSEVHDLSESHPEKLRELIDLWWIEAGRYGVLPLDDRSFQLTGPQQRPGGVHEHLKYHYIPPISRVPAAVAPAMGLGEWTMTLDLERADSSEEGLLFSKGTQNTGIVFYLQGNKLHFDYNAFTDITFAESDLEVPTGRTTVGVRFEGEGIGGSGRVIFSIDGKDAGTTELPFLMRGVGGSGARIGSDHQSPVSPRYEPPFEFAGTIHAVDIEVTPYATGARLVKRHGPQDIYSASL
jgi:arylsulfatase